MASNSQIVPQAPEIKIVAAAIDLSRYNPLLTYNPILQPTTYLSTVVGTF